MLHPMDAIKDICEVVFEEAAPAWTLLSRASVRCYLNALYDALDRKDQEAVIAAYDDCVKHLDPAYRPDAMTLPDGKATL